MRGQDFDIVFLMGMDDQTFPDYRVIESDGIEMEKEKNRLYIALTRGNRFLYITWPQKRKKLWMIQNEDHGMYQERQLSRFLKIQ